MDAFEAETSDKVKKLTYAQEISAQLATAVLESDDDIKAQNEFVSYLNELLNDDELDYEYFKDLIDRRFGSLKKKISMLEPEDVTEELFEYYALCELIGEKPKKIKKENIKAESKRLLERYTEKKKEDYVYQNLMEVFAELNMSVVLFPSFEERKTAVREAKRYILSELQLNEPDTCFTLLVFLVSFGVSSDLIKYLSNAKFNQKSHTPKKGLITDGEDLLKFTKTEVLQLLDGVRKSKEAFKKCSIPTKYEMIDNNAFENIKEIDYLILSDNISVIGNSAFSWAVIHQLRIPSSVKKVASNAFKGFTGVIECEANSYICKYAMQRNIRYRIIN